MPYTPQQIAQLKLRCNQLKPDFIIKAVAEGAVRIEELPLTPERRAAIEQLIRTTPNAAEQAAWQEIEKMRADGASADALEARLNEYVAAWGQLLPPQNHVTQATEALFALMDSRERGEWETVDRTDYDALRAYIVAHPASPFAQEAEEAIWNASKDFLPDLQRYLNDFPAGAYTAEARRYISENTEWEQVRMRATALDLVNYIHSHPRSPYISAARALLERKREETLQEMRLHPSNFRLSDIQGLISYGIVTENDLITHGIVTAEVFRRINTAPSLVAPEMTTPPDLSGQNSSTDIYLFGVPSSGKTCVLSGLLGSQRWSSIDFVANGAADYIEYLEMCRREGIVPGRTVGNFIALIHAQVQAEQNSRVVHDVNLVDMAGEDFAEKIVKNPKAIVRFEDMGIGVTELMSNANRKVFFIVIDPSSDGIITFDRKDENGNPIIGPDGKVLRASTTQDIVLRRMISMIAAPENRDVLKRVDAIHFIMSKADCLGPREGRDAKALNRFQSLYRTAIGELTALCKKHGINSSTDGHPVLHTFSLGQFYIGGLYSYDPTDSDKLVDIFCSVSRGRKTGGFFNF